MKLPSFPRWTRKTRRYFDSWARNTSARWAAEDAIQGQIRWLIAEHKLQLKIRPDDGGSSVPVMEWPCGDDFGVDVVRMWIAWTKRAASTTRGPEA